MKEDNKETKYQKKKKSKQGKLQKTTTKNKRLNKQQNQPNPSLLLRSILCRPYFFTPTVAVYFL